MKEYIRAYIQRLDECCWFEQRDSRDNCDPRDAKALLKTDRWQYRRGSLLEDRGRQIAREKETDRSSSNDPTIVIRCIMIVSNVLIRLARLTVLICCVISNFCVIFNKSMDYFVSTPIIHFFRLLPERLLVPLFFVSPL